MRTNMKPTYNCYQDYEKSIKKLVWYYCKRSRFSFDELLSEANIGFLKAVDTYDENKSCFHTYLIVVVGNRIKNYINQKEPIFNDDVNLVSSNRNPEQECSFRNLIENLSAEAREVVDTVLNTPGEMIELVKEMTSNRQGKMHLYKTTITRYFRSKGWRFDMINAAYSEIKSIL